jgi:UDPglucose 6-dehydrogenase
MSKFVISGYGYVGKATQLTLLEAGIAPDNIAVNDPPLDMHSGDWSEKKWHFVCVPTPSGDEEEAKVSGFNSSIVVDSINKALAGGFKGITVIRSTLDPITMSDIHAQLTDDLIVWPEFLRKASWSIDAVSPILSLAGGKHVDKLNDTFRKNFKIKHIMSDPVAACVAKLSINSLLAARTIQAYNIKTVCDRMGVDWNQVATVISEEPRLGYSHWQQPGPDGQYGFGGSCFPKDTSAMAHTMKSLGVDDSYAEWAFYSNLEIRI